MRHKYLKKEFIPNYNKFCKRKIGHALLYFKTDPFASKRLASNYTHSNNWEILEIVRILNELGFWVDVVDRGADIEKFHPEDKYDIFIGNAAGNSGKYYARIASELNKATKIFYAAGPEPGLSNKLIMERYEQFSKRHDGKKLILRRTIDNPDMDEKMKYTDVIFAMGNEFGINSYKKYKKPIFTICPSTSPKIKTDLAQLTKRKQNKFLYFGGNGNLVKGLDVVIEVFSGLPELELYICAPENESDFNKYYRDFLSQSKNIHCFGFIPIAGKLFNKITSECGYIIFPSCSEGTATSVVTCMRRGLIPIVTYETGVDIEDFGFQIKDIEIDALRKQILDIFEIPDKAFVEMSIKTYINSFKYTQENFSFSFRKALLSTIKNFRLGDENGRKSI